MISLMIVALSWLNFQWAAPCAGVINRSLFANSFRGDHSGYSSVSKFEFEIF